MLDSFTNMINGERTEQSFNIHTGSGSNSKSILFTIIDKAFGDYYLSINAETLTKPKKEGNSTGELYQAKGKRCLFSNEPENDKDNKLQVGLLKKIAGGCKETLKERGLYQEAIEFPIQFQLNLVCNSKPALSSVDGGMARRISVCNYRVKFVENPDENNINQANCPMTRPRPTTCVLATASSSSPLKPRRCFSRPLPFWRVPTTFSVRSRGTPGRLLPRLTPRAGPASSGRRPGPPALPCSPPPQLLFLQRLLRPCPPCSHLLLV